MIRFLALLLVLTCAETAVADTIAIGKVTRQSAMRPLVVRPGCPLRTRAMSADVPPISMVIRSPKPAAWATNEAPTMPAAGPDKAVSTGVRRIARVLATPPELFISSRGAEMRCCSARRSSLST